MFAHGLTYITFLRSSGLWLRDTAWLPSSLSLLPVTAGILQYISIQFEILTNQEAPITGIHCKMPTVCRSLDLMKKRGGETAPRCDVVLQPLCSIESVSLPRPSKPEHSEVAWRTITKGLVAVIQF